MWRFRVDDLLQIGHTESPKDSRDIADGIDIDKDKREISLALGKSGI